MKKFAQTAILVAGLAGLSACASHGDTTYGDRTAGEKTFIEGQTGSETVSRTAGNDGDMRTLQMCLEREQRLMDMNKACYRK